ncbi:MAG TPA: hypothetical protein VKZ79_21015 [Alphaproteobacteria bacterium]|nr:hypothetical protein [Alphaproteobacteria bacterium]
MDLKELRDRALEAATRFFVERDGILPDQEGDEWEAEYRRQYELLKRHAPEPHRARPERRAAPAHREWPELAGSPAAKRWATELRGARLAAIESKELRDWLAATWTTAADWVNTRDMSTSDFLRRISPQYSASRRDAKTRADEHAATERAKLAAANALRDRLQSAGITAGGLIGLVDVSPRMKAAPPRGKLAELKASDRNLRIFETGDPNILAVIEKSEARRHQYAIERDEGLVADLRLFAEAGGASSDH